MSRVPSSKVSGLLTNFSKEYHEKEYPNTSLKIYYNPS